MTISFLNLPDELQIEMVNNISLYSDLKALCLVSKAFYNLTTPLIYYKVELVIENTSGEEFPSEEQNGKMLSRIRSLLLQPTNLGFVRVFKTGSFGLGPTILMDELLPLLRKDSLIEFSYSTNSKYCFPTPLQLEFLWGRQKRLQNLKLYSHMVYWLKGFLQERKSSQKVILKSFTELSIGNGYEFYFDTPNLLTWPFRNLDMCLLNSLSLSGSLFCEEYRAVMDLFVGQSFANLTHLSLKDITFEKTVTFANVPKLKSLVIDHCDDAIDYVNDVYTERLPFEFPDNFQLQSLTYWGYGKAEPVTHLLAQVKGLKKLVIGVSYTASINDQAITDFTGAVMLHKDTLGLFEIIAPIRGYTTLFQIFPRLRLENLPNFYTGVWRSSLESYTIFRLSALVEQSSCS